MRYLLFTDNHFCETASIINKYGAKYSMRIENQLESINWLEQLAVEKQCDAVICLGDFFDRPNLNDNEITAVKEIKWNGLPHLFIVGNHESNVQSLECSSTMMLKDFNREIISQPCTYPINDRLELCILPYIIESERKPLAEYFGPKKPGAKRIILSHNDLKGVQMGPVVSKSGFDLKDIEENCNLFLNGHLHNGQKITDAVINLGNLTGKDFGEDATKYKHNVMILDPDLLAYELIENPYAFNFYQVAVENEKDLKQLSKLKSNAVVSVKCTSEFVPEVKRLIENNQNIVAHRVIAIVPETDTSAAQDLASLVMNDPLTTFVDYFKTVCGSSDVVNAELAEICK